MSMQVGRTARFRRDDVLERRLEELSALLAPAEAQALRQAPGRSWPLVWIVGAPRSGTTLMLQWLAASGACAYPSNLLSRFYAAPAIGARIQRILCDPGHAATGELAEFAAGFGFDSDLGKTRGVLAPHEFWYFWRRFLPTVDIEPLGERAELVDWVGLRAELQAVADVFAQPFACKGLMIQYDLALALDQVPEARVLFIERDARANAESLLRARERFFGDRNRWYSAKPPGYARLREGAPEQQVAGQVQETNANIAEALANLPQDRWMRVAYEDFCADTQATWSALRALLPDVELPPRHPGPHSFDSTNP